MVLPLPLPGNITIRDHIVRGNSWLLSHLYGEKNITQSNKKYSSVSVNEELRRSRGQEKEERWTRGEEGVEREKGKKGKMEGRFAL